MPISHYIWTLSYPRATHDVYQLDAACMNALKLHAVQETPMTAWRSKVAVKVAYPYVHLGYFEIHRHDTLVTRLQLQAATAPTTRG